MAGRPLFSLYYAVEVASCLGKDPARLFKTLVAVGKTRAHYVFMVPAPKELDLNNDPSAEPVVFHMRA